MTDDDQAVVEVSILGGPFDGTRLRMRTDQVWVRLLLPLADWIHVHDLEKRDDGALAYRHRERLGLVFLENA